LLLVDVEARDRPGGADHLREHAGDDADAAAEVGHFHPFPEARFEQDPAAGGGVQIVQYMKTTNRRLAGRKCIGIRLNYRERHQGPFGRVRGEEARPSE
jgi:hypothetical protein